MNRTDIAILVVDAQEGRGDSELQLIRLFREKEIPYLVVFNKADLLPELPAPEPEEHYVSAKTGYGIRELKERMARMKTEGPERRLIGDILEPNDLVILVVPIDKAAPKGRLILPQQQTIRDLLDSGCAAAVVR